MSGDHNANQKPRAVALGKRYKTVRYDTASFYLPEGWYSVKDLEAILNEVYRERKQFDDMLKRSMEPMKKGKKCPT